MTVVAQRTRFGRYVFATGGNPEAAELSGIDTRLLTVKVFALMGALTAIAAVIASARLNAVGNDLGTLDELRIIAAAVIGGTALAGGVGTIYGAVLGALIMQSLQSGMAMVGVDAPLQSIVVGLVLVFAVWVDIVYRAEDRRHDARRSSRCATSASASAASRPSTTSPSISSPARSSACSATTAPASRR